MSLVLINVSMFLLAPTIGLTGSALQLLFYTCNYLLSGPGLFGRRAPLLRLRLIWTAAVLLLVYVFLSVCVITADNPHVSCLLRFVRTGTPVNNAKLPYL